MKPITFENLRRFISGGRKKREKESSFKRSDSFKRISIRKSYLDRGKKKHISKLEVATQTVSEEEILLSQIPEEHPSPIKKVDTSVQVNKHDFNATIISGRELPCNLNYRKTKHDNFEHRVEQRPIAGNSVVAYNQWLQGIKKEDTPAVSVIKGSERTIIYVPAFDDHKAPNPVIRQLSSSPVLRKHTSKTQINSSFNLTRKESNDSAVEMFPWGDATEVKKSPILRRRSRQSNVNLLSNDSGSEDLCSLSISLGRIWMDAPQVMAPRSLEMPKPSSSSSNVPPAHNSLDSALRDLREDPLVSNRLQKRPTPPVGRTLSSTSNNTNSTGLFSSKDSGFSFSISAPKLSDFHSNFAPSNRGFFRKKSRPKPKLSVSRDGYFKRTSSTSSAVPQEPKRNSVRRKSSKKKKKKNKKDTNGTVRSDLYTVVVRRPQRLIPDMKLDPMIFVPPEKRKPTDQKKPAFRKNMTEIRNFNPLDTSMYSTKSFDSDEGLYESLPGDYDYFSDEQPLSGRISRISLHDHDLQDFSEESSISNPTDDESDHCTSPYIPPGVSPVPKRKPVRRKKSIGLSHKKSITYVVKPSIIRAPSTLRRKSTKKLGKKGKHAKSSTDTTHPHPELIPT